METPTNQACRKNSYQKVTFEHKLFVIDQINNGQISANFASKKYNISRATIHYWMEKLSNYTNQKKFVSKDDEIRKLKEKIADLEGIRYFQQDVIIEFEKNYWGGTFKKVIARVIERAYSKKKELRSTSRKPKIK